MYRIKNEDKYNHLSSSILKQIENKLLQLYNEDKQEENIMKAIEYIRNEITTDFDIEFKGGQEEEIEYVEEETISSVPKIYHSSSLKYKKSKFIAHLAIVNSEKEVELVKEHILKDNKVANATHNMYAYRIESEIGLNEYENDDGESGAGDKLLNLLRNLDLKNVFIMVTRWFGGTLLGPDRFKCIVNVAFDLIKSTISLENDEVSEKKKKLRTISDVLHRIKWDPEFDPSLFTIGYEDRFCGIQEVSFEEWEALESEVPLHRVQYFKRDGNVVWDRKSRTDLLFKS